MCDHQWLDVLLPHLAGVAVEQIERTGSGVGVWARVKAEHGIFPSCNGRSRRVHSRYHRWLADGSVAGQPVVLRLQVRRFFCDTNECVVWTFAEQVDGLPAKHARRTSWCRAVLEHIGGLFGVDQPGNGSCAIPHFAAVARASASSSAEPSSVHTWSPVRISAGGRGPVAGSVSASRTSRSAVAALAVGAAVAAVRHVQLGGIVRRDLEPGPRSHRAPASRFRRSRR